MTKTRKTIASTSIVAVALLLSSCSVAGDPSASSEQSTPVDQSARDDGPRYAAGNELLFPENYREWTFLSSGLSMTYEGEGDGSDQGLRRFQNVFVNPSSYSYFKEHGRWPDGTAFILEIRAAATEGSINKAGRFQTDLLSMEAEVKDSRFPDGWAFYNFGRAADMPPQVAPLSGEAVEGCVQCHTEHTAAERTFVQFYPTLFAIAKSKGTLNPGFE